MTKYDLNLRDYWRVIKKRKFIVIFTLLAMVVFSFISAIVTRPVPLYKTNATINFERNTGGSGLYESSWMTGANLETEAAVIKSYYIQELVAKRLNLIPEDASQEMVRNNSKYINIILDLKDKIQTDIDRLSNMIDIIVTSTDTKLAQNIANTVAQVYREEHFKKLNRQTGESRKFIESQLAISRDRLAKSEEAVKEFREKNKFVTLEGESSALSSQLARLRDAYDKDHTVYQQAVQMLQFLQGAEDRNLPSDTAFSFTGATSAYTSLNDRLVQLTLQKNMLLLGYTENFPQVMEIKNQIREVLRAMRTQLSAQEKNLAASLSLLRRQITDIEDKLRRIPEKGLELTRLERTVGVDKEIYILLEKKYQEALIKEAAKVEEVQVVKPALEPTVPVNMPKTGVNTILGMIIGLILGVVFAFLIETFDTSIGAIEEIEAFLETRVLGIIPYLKIEDVKEALKGQLAGDVHDEILKRQFRLISHFLPTSTLAENYRALRTNFNFLSVEKDIKSVTFTSTYPEEGKTSVTCNLAITMAQAGRKVLLIDGDFRRPVISRVFGIDAVPGFTDVILGNYEWRSVIRSVTDLMMGKMSVEDVTKTPGLDNLYLLTSGTSAPNPAELICSKSVNDLMAIFRDEYDMVLIDAPPVLAATDATIWSGLADGVILVYQVGRAARGALKRAKAQLDNVKAQVLGIVLNGLKADISPDFTYQDKYDYYYGGYGHDKKKKKTLVQKVLLFFKAIQTKGVLTFLSRKKEEAASGEVREQKMESPAPETKRPQTTEQKPPQTTEAKSFQTTDEKPPGRAPLVKKLVLLLCLVFLIIGVLFQTGYLSLDMFTKKAATIEKQIQPQIPYPRKETSETEGLKRNQAIKDLQAAASSQRSVAPVAKPLKPLETQSTMAAGEIKRQPDANRQQNKPYVIRIATFSNPRNAQEMVDHLQKNGITAFIKQATMPDKGVFHRIYIGHFEDHQSAAVFIRERRIRDLYPDSVIRKLPVEQKNKGAS
ncbi:MAG: AAA family ATPase [Syntrophales bacterium]|nr:AAA family ATPase [Syntrophales bacterium]